MGSRIALCLLLASSVAAAKKEDRTPRRWIEVRAEPSEVTLGGKGPQVVVLDIRVHDARAERLTDADIILHATAGEVVDLKETAPGRFIARLRRPKEHFPQLAVVSAADLSEVALGEPPWVGTATVTYSARTLLSGRTEPNARMEVRIGKRAYGPVKADRHGQFSIPIMVEPGEMWAKGISRDALGNASRSRINMYLPEVQRVHGFVYPRSLIADGTDAGWIYVTTASHSGAPEDAPIQVRAARGEVSRATRMGKGLFRVTYRAPAGVGDGSDVVTVVRKTKSAEVKVQLISGAPARAQVRIAPQPALADGETRPVIDIDVDDAHGNAVADQVVTLAVGDAALPVSQPEPGRYRAELPARHVVGRAQARVLVTPASTGCHRGRLVRGTEGWYVVDARGVGCAGQFHVVESGGTIAREGELASNGLLTDAKPLLAAFSAGARLEVDGAEPRRIAVHAGTRATRGVDLAEPVVVEEAVYWRLPVAVDLSIREISRDGGRVRLRVEMRGGAPTGRVSVTAGAAAVEVVATDETGLEAVVFAQPPLDVVATDGDTGVSAWLRIR